MQLGFWHGVRAGLSRRSAGIAAPHAFADALALREARDADHAEAMYLFNCKQRAHSNYLETMPSTALALLLAGLQYPRAATLLGLGWMGGRIVYAVGYTRPDKAHQGGGRFVGFLLSQPLALALWGLAAWSGIQWTL